MRNTDVEPAKSRRLGVARQGGDESELDEFDDRI
jgi:hypothetical protein